MVAEDEIGQFEELEDKFATEAEEILEQAHSIIPIHGFSALKFYRIDLEDKTIEFKGYESWDGSGCCGHDDYEYEMRLNILYDENKRTQYLNSRKKEKERDDKFKEEEETRYQNERREEFKKLKAEFEKEES